MRLSSFRTTIQKLLDPLRGDGVTTVHSAEERSSYGRIRVCVPVAHDSICHFRIRLGSAAQAYLTSRKRPLLTS
jgi:hypothetical protein